MNPDDFECPECHSDWRGSEISRDSLEKGYYGHKDPCKKLREWDDGFDDATPCTCPVRYYSRLFGVEDGTYDGVSWWVCPDCGSRWSRWTGEMVTREESRERRMA